MKRVLLLEVKSETPMTEWTNISQNSWRFWCDNQQEQMSGWIWRFRFSNGGLQWLPCLELIFSWILFGSSSLNIVGNFFLEVLLCWSARKMVTSIHRLQPEKANCSPKAIKPSPQEIWLLIPKWLFSLRSLKIDVIDLTKYLEDAKMSGVESSSKDRRAINTKAYWDQEYRQEIDTIQVG